MLTCPACGRPSAPDASFCMGCGGPRGATATAHEVRKTVTALFCDLVGSVTLLLEEAAGIHAAAGNVVGSARVARVLEA
jgi:hypothetical protein